MHSRLMSLIERGYSVDDVVNLSSFTDDELNYAVEMAFEHISRNCSPVDDKKAIYIGGQPGCGKTVLSIGLKNKIGNAVEIGIDNYRMYHPRYLEMEKCIRSHWIGRKESDNDTPGNDIADFTHTFAGAITDRLIEKCSSLGYNLIIEWGMREPTGPLKTMNDLKIKEYNNLVMFVATHKDLSYNACKLRSDVMKDSPRIIRKVPKSFHDHCVDTLPDSINKIYTDGYKSDIVDHLVLVSRDGKIIWDDKSKKMPGDIYKEYINMSDLKKGVKNDPNISMENNEKELSIILDDDNNDLADETTYIYSVVMPNLDQGMKIKR